MRRMDESVIKVLERLGIDSSAFGPLNQHNHVAKIVAAAGAG